MIMPDDRTIRGPADRSRINVNESYEVRYWCQHFGCTEQQLRDAVKAVGVMADAVRRHLRQVDAERIAPPEKAPDHSHAGRNKTFDIFISHSSKDDAMARAIRNDLAHRGVECWLDKENLKPGDDWTRALTKALDESRMCLLVISGDAEPKSWVSNEWAMIQAKAWDRKDLSVVPILLDDAELPTFTRRWPSLRCKSQPADIRRVCAEVLERLETEPVGGSESPARDQEDTIKRFRELSEQLQVLLRSRQTKGQSSE
jgi:hypothetical protein